ncbi:MAG: hypothetical protein QNK37_29140 [Acidobacteriota bacterium]|nr:hypothetical protein [Acidobacteriota bacterium]
MNADEFKKALASYKETCRNHLEQSKRLLNLLDQDPYRDLVEKPFLLRMVLEKYIDLMDDRLIPTLRSGNGEESGPKAEVRKPEKKVETAARAVPVQTSSPKASSDRARSTSDVWTAPKPHSSDIYSPRPSGVAKPQTAEPKQSPVQKQPSAAAPKEEKKEYKRGKPPRSFDGLKGPAHEEDSHGRRTIPRYTRRLPVRYSVLGRDTTMQRAFSRDVGAKGLFIMANRPEKVGNALDIEVDMPETGMVRIQAIVAWTKWVPQNLRAVDYSGFGVRINTATENWYRYFMELESGPSAAE